MPSLSYLVLLCLQTHMPTEAGQIVSEVGLVSEKPQCKQDEKWPLTLRLRNEKGFLSGGWEQETASPQPIASCPQGDPLWPEVQNFYGKLESIMIKCVLFMFKCCQSKLNEQNSRVNTTWTKLGPEVSVVGPPRQGPELTFLSRGKTLHT